MNKYPLWKYLVILAILIPGFFYALPNLYGEKPAIQVSGVRTAKVDAAVLQRIESTLQKGGVAYTSAVRNKQGADIRFKTAEDQLKAQELLQDDLGDKYVVALHLAPATPEWLRALGAKPMYLGLDLRGGVHFLMQVDVAAAFKRAEDRYVRDVRTSLREARVRYSSVERLPSGGVEIEYRDAAQVQKGENSIDKDFHGELTSAEKQRGGLYQDWVLSEAEKKHIRDFALEQNMTSLRNRVNELGVAEPVIQQQGEDRIVVQLPGVQDPARAKEILGRTATLEVMMVDEEHSLVSALQGHVPPGSKIFRDRQGRPILLKNDVIYSGDNIVDAAAGFDQNGGPVVHLTLDARGAAINERITGKNIGKRMAVVYLETRTEMKKNAEGKEVRVRKHIEEVITAPVIKDQLGKRFQIEGLDSIEEARNLSLLLRAGALAAPIEIIEERTIGPSLGQENIDQGFESAMLGFGVVAFFMLIYYRSFGLIADLALALNLVLIVAILSFMQATLTLPGVAGILLTVGMAVDANVLINERIREELRNGNTPQASIHAGYDRAMATIVDANITTLIAAVVLFNFGTGPIKGFAVTLSIGIVTSMFTAIMVTRAVVNLAYGGRRLKRLSI